VPQIGDTVGRYVIEAVLGEGGMGRVYRALDPSLGRRVALKVLVAEGKNEAARAEAAARMMREARAVATFTHPNVVAIYDVGQVEGAPFIAMELVSGSTLRALVGSSDVPNAQKLAWLVEVAKGLGAAHRAGLVHRDIKPENVMITADGVVKVLDFGIARRAETDGVDATTPAHAAHLPSVTAEGLAIGTPQYMAPEQLQAGPLDGRCDQYAWGVMAYEIFAGKVPWGSRDGAQLVAAILASPVAPLRDVVPSMDPRVSDVVRRAMQRDRDARYPSMTELVEALAPVVRRSGRPAPIVITSGDTPDPSAATTAQPMASRPPAARSGSVAKRRAILTAAALGIVSAGMIGQRLYVARHAAAARVALDVAIRGPLPPSPDLTEPKPWAPPPDGELHLWSSGRDRGQAFWDLPRYCRPFLENATKTDAHKLAEAWLAESTDGLPLEQVEFCRSPEVVEFFRGSYPIMRHLSKARDALAEISKHVSAAATRRLARGEAPLCPSSARIPPEMNPPGEMYQPFDTDWTQDPGWSCIGFSIDGPVSFQYGFDTTPTTFAASATSLFVSENHGPARFGRLWRVTMTTTGTVRDGQVLATPEIEEKWEKVQ
jgi:serine/threonine protein kinase